MPVGLMSSKGIPNPNGMIILGFFLSVLPNLLSISFFLGSLQIIFILLVGGKSFVRNWHHLLLATVPSLTYVILRSSSVEFWNQYTITLLNILFIFWSMRYLEKPSLWNIPPIVIVIVMAPSLYLAGIANAIAMTVLTTGILLYKKPGTKNLVAVMIIILLVIVGAIVITWLPYFQSVNIEQIRSFNKHGLGILTFLKHLWLSILGTFTYITFHWSFRSIFASAFKHADERLISQSSRTFLNLVGISFLLQSIFAYATGVHALLRLLLSKLYGRVSSLNINKMALRLVILSTLFVVLSFSISAYLGGPDWLHGDRLDQTVQFLPLLLYLIFLLPVTFTYSGAHQTLIHGISFVLLSFFATVNLVCGFMLIRDHLQYQGNIITEADVPLIDKMHAVEFIVDDWKKISNSRTIPVDYALDGQTWGFVPTFGIQLVKWYSAPMTQGRSFDYEFLRRYGFANEQEGIQMRSCDRGRYLLTYAFEDPPQLATNPNVTHHYFGRLKVCVIEK